MTDVNEINLIKTQEKDREKDSGNDSPGADPTLRDDEKNGHIDSDPDMKDVEGDDEVDDIHNVYERGTNNLPPGFTRDTQGRIIVSVFIFLWN